MFDNSTVQSGGSWYRTSILPVSVFNRNISEPMYEQSTYGGYYKVTEDLLNEVLANVTISALSLNTRYDIVDGFANKTVGVYQFRGKVSFYLAYGLPLLLTIPVVVLGLAALQHNGVSAIEGGFVQLLMTTTGYSELHNVAAKGCMGGQENVPKDLMKLKVRFGELLDVSQPQKETSSPIGITIIGGREPGTASDNAYIHAEAEQDRGTDEISALIPDVSESSSGECSVDVTSKRSIASDSDTQGLGENKRVFRGAGFGLFHETKKLVRGVRYGEPHIEDKKNC